MEFTEKDMIPMTFEEFVSGQFVFTNLSIFNNFGTLSNHYRKHENASTFIDSRAYDIVVWGVKTEIVKHSTHCNQKKKIR